MLHTKLIYSLKIFCCRTVKQLFNLDSCRKGAEPKVRTAVGICEQKLKADLSLPENKLKLQLKVQLLQLLNVKDYM
jgi:hypothetical protein